jgi:hypothetical protein
VIALYMIIAGWIGFMLGFFLAALMAANGRDR